MYRDNSLIPSEAIRLLALGIVAQGQVRYADLAGEIRRFTGRIVGPSLDLVATPLEVLRIEGLVESEGEGESGLLSITPGGEDELKRLLGANVRVPASEMNRLILAVKMRFLHLLEPAEQRLQAEMLLEMSERQLVRLTELRADYARDEGCLPGWLDLEISYTRQQRDWFANHLATCS